jgi:hypothetical protein
MTDSTDLSQSGDAGIDGYQQAFEFSVNRPHKHLTIEEVNEIERRISLGWRIHSDLKELLMDVRHYLKENE